MVTARKVTRYFVNGKGYASERRAYLAVAKAKLSEEIVKRSLELVNEDDIADLGEWNAHKDALHRAYCERFPTHTDDDWKPYPHESDCGDNVRWCNECRWDWIRAEADRLAQQPKGAE